MFRIRSHICRSPIPVEGEGEVEVANQVEGEPKKVKRGGSIVCPHGNVTEFDKTVFSHTEAILKLRLEVAS